MAQLADDEKLESNKNFEFNLYNQSWFTVTNKNTIRRINDSSYWRPCFGNTIIDTGNNADDSTKIKSVEWKVKINQTTSKNIMIGVCKDSYVTDNYGSYTTANGYMKNCNGPYLYHQSGNTNYGAAINGSGAIIIVNFDVREKKLSFTVDGHNYGVAWSSLPSGKYRLALDILTANDEVSVIYEKIHYDNHLLCTLDSLKQWKNDLEFSIISINKQQKSLADVPVETLLKDAQYLPEVRNKILEFEKNLEEYKEKLNTYEKDLNKSLVPKKKNYKEWNSQDIVKWILTLDDGIYKPYSQKLAQAFKENQIAGDDLAQINKNDLFLFGVTVFKHRVSLLSHFSLLSEKGGDHNHNGGGENDEGEHETPID